jgi:hypothetical protein
MPRMVTEFVNNMNEDKMFSHFRLGYCFGQCVPGWMYFNPEPIYKGGVAKGKQAYKLPEEFHAPIKASMDELGVDVAHIEGCITLDKKLVLFDINPYPTASGHTLIVITEACAAIIEKKLKE